MKTPLPRFILLIGLLAVPLAAQPASLTAEQRQARAKQATEQRLAHAASAQYNPYDTKNRDIRKTAFELLDQKKFPEAIAIAAKGLEQFPCEIELRLVLTIAWRAVGDPVKADQFGAEYTALLDSIMDSGTGHDYASAFKVISVDEEYCALRALRLRVVSQALKYHEGNAYDLMTVKRDGADATFDLYFNVELPNRWMRKQFEGTGKK
jgi:hypothetical protein